MVIFDQKLCIRLLKLCFLWCLSWFFLFFLSFFPCFHFIVQVNLQCHSPYLYIILCYFMLLFLSFLCLHHFFLSVLTFPLSFLFPLDVQLFLFFMCSSFQPSTFISIPCLRIFPSDSRQTQWVTLMFSHNLTGGQGLD